VRSEEGNAKYHFHWVPRAYLLEGSRGSPGGSPRRVCYNIKRLHLAYDRAVFRRVVKGAKFRQGNATE
jgi:hypothetical protein